MKKENKRFANHFLLCLFSLGTQSTIDPRALCVIVHNCWLLVGVEMKEISSRSSVVVVTQIRRPSLSLSLMLLL